MTTHKQTRNTDRKRRLILPPFDFKRKAVGTDRLEDRPGPAVMTNRPWDQKSDAEVLLRAQKAVNKGGFEGIESFGDRYKGILFEIRRRDRKHSAGLEERLVFAKHTSRPWERKDEEEVRGRCQQAIAEFGFRSFAEFASTYKGMALAARKSEVHDELDFRT